MNIHKLLFLLQCHELVPGTCVCLIQPPAASPSAGTMLRVPWGSTRSPTAPWQETPTAGWRLWVIRWSLLETRRPLTFKNQHFLLVLSRGQACCVWMRFSQFKCCSFLYKDVINIVQSGWEHGWRPDWVQLWFLTLLLIVWISVEKRISLDSSWLGNYQPLNNAVLIIQHQQMFHKSCCQSAEEQHSRFLDW